MLEARSEDDGAVAEGTSGARQAGARKEGETRNAAEVLDSRKRAAEAVARRHKTDKKQTTMEDWANAGRGAQKSTKHTGESAGQVQGTDAHGDEGAGNEGQVTDPETGGPNPGGTDGRVRMIRGEGRQWEQRPAELPAPCFTSTRLR